MKKFNLESFYKLLDSKAFNWKMFLLYIGVFLLQTILTFVLFGGSGTDLLLVTFGYDPEILGSGKYLVLLTELVNVLPGLIGFVLFVIVIFVIVNYIILGIARLFKKKLTIKSLLNLSIVLGIVETILYIISLLILQVIDLIKPIEEYSEAFITTTFDVFSFILNIAMLVLFAFGIRYLIRNNQQ